MELAEVVRRRRMVRCYDPDRPVPTEVRDRILDHARRSPSAGFSQGFAFLVCESVAERDQFWTAATPPEGGHDSWYAGMRRAPLVVLVFSCRDAYLDRYAEPDKGWTDRDEARWPVPYWHIDSGMAALLMLLTATDAGLGACFFGIPPERIGLLRGAFGVPDNQTPIGAVSIGYPAAGERRIGSATSRRRRPKEEQVHRGHW
jgi:nitroreductase